MTKETLEREYKENQLTVTEIAEKYNISSTTVYVHLKKHNIEIRPRHKNSEKVLTNLEEQFIFGKILGDGYLRPNTDVHNSQMSFAHEIKQKEYCEYSYSFIKDWAKEPVYRVANLNPNVYKKPIVEKYVVETISHPEFTRLRRYFYEHGKKIINNDILSNLTDLSLAIWYQDDGTIERCTKTGKTRGMKICTNAFPLFSVELICKWLKTKYDINANPSFSQYGKDGIKQYTVRIPRAYTLQFSNIIKPYVHESMLYKLVDDIV
jgi:hypothetical protein